MALRGSVDFHPQKALPEAETAGLDAHYEKWRTDRAASLGGAALLEVPNITPRLAEGPEHTDVREFWNTAHGVRPDGAPVPDPRTQQQGEN